MLEEGASPLPYRPAEQFREEAGHAALLAAQVKFQVRVVGLAGEDEQVVRGVVALVAVTVMHDLAGQEWTAQRQFSQDAVLAAPPSSALIPDFPVGSAHLKESIQEIFLSINLSSGFTTHPFYKPTTGQ